MTSDVNTADSLRAAALSTIKAKRKKLEKPIRPQPASASLDYGQDDAFTTPALESNPVNPSSHPEITSEQPSHGKSDSLIAPKEDEDVQMREEGEISDEDGGRTSQAPQLADPTPDPVAEHTASIVLAPAVKEEPESPKDTIFNFPIPVVSTVTTEDIVMDELAASPPVPDSTQIRPGFILNRAQYDRAKDLVLDLLGWGVPSEYLVDCGLSREIVFYVFSELQLRLPANLDVTGLSLGTGRTPSSRLISLQSSSVLSSEPHLNSLPISSTLQPPISLVIPSLHDIEQQRRNELLARKAAAQTYQRVAQGSNTPSHPPEQDHDIAMDAAPVMEEAVDDFLKTITPSAELQAKTEDSLAALETEMEDALAPLEDAPRQDDVFEDPPPLSGQSATTSFSDVPPLPSSVSTPSTASFPPDSTISDQFPRELTFGTSSRRGGQRPVAADFVDFEASSSNGPSSSYRDLTQSNSHVPSRHRQSSTSNSSFASVSGARRCVIDLSDSEDDARNLDMIDSGLNGARNLNRHYRPDLSLGKFDLPVTAGGLQTPTSGIDRGMSPASLEEKVQEIKRMRELIAKREQSRLTKLSRSSSVLGTPTADVALSTPDIVNSLLPGMAEDSAGSDPLGNLSNAQLQWKSPLVNHELDDVQPFAHPVFHEEPCSAPVSAPQEPSHPHDHRDSEPHTVTRHSPELALSSVQRPVSPRTSPAAPAADTRSDRSGSPDLPTRTSEMERPVSQHEDLQPAASTSTIPPTDIVTAEDFPTDITGDYFSYVSPLRGLPFLVARSRSTASGLVSPHSITSSSVPFDGVPVVDLQPLKSVFYVDPMKQVCRYESGGGECRNTGCDDVHLSRSDPDVHLTDQDIADYLEGALPGDWRAHHRVDAQRIVKGLQELRSTTESARQPIHQPLEQRVALLLRSLVREQ